MGAFPLIYDESGSSEWLLGAGGIVEDVFFAELLESTGGQCLGCLPPEEQPKMGVVGKISMLMDSEGVVQVKINDEVTTPPTSVLPLVFDITLRQNANPLPPTIGTPRPVPIGFIPSYVGYAIVNMDGVLVAEMRCEHRGEFSCELRIPEFNNLVDEAYKVQLLSIERMIMTNTAPNIPHDGIGVGTGTAVRID